MSEELTEIELRALAAAEAIPDTAFNYRYLNRLCGLGFLRRAYYLTSKARAYIAELETWPPTEEDGNEAE